MLTFSKSHWFYLFSGFHSFIIGLFVFFTPVWLWEQGYGFDTISWVIAGIALSFLVTLRILDVYKKRLSLSKIMNLSFIVGILIIGLSFFVSHSWFIPLFCIFLGVHGCLFWTPQRVLFLDMVTHKDSGKNYGNLQIFVFIVLKLSILIGGLLAESNQFLWILFLSMISSGIFLLFLKLNTIKPSWPNKFLETQTFPFLAITKWKDTHRSKSIFLIDGPFLFLESWFWTISLFWISGENFFHFGILIITLSVLFSFLFWILKNVVDRLHLEGKNIYKWATILYALSWILRGVLPSLETHWSITGIFLVCILFFTSYFRLLFNKQFYDTANATSKHAYLFLKSYYSQSMIVLFFGLLGVGFYFFNWSKESLFELYSVLGIVSLGYLAYRPSKGQ